MDLLESEVSDCEYDETEELREELINLSNKGLIKKTSGQIKRMKLASLARLKQSYLASQTESISDMLCRSGIKATSKLFECYRLVDSANEMHNDLTSNEIFMSELKSLLSNVAGYIPYIGIGLGAMVVFSHIKSSKHDRVQVEVNLESA